MKNLKSNKTHVFYSEIIKKLNSSLFKNIFEINQIYCFIIKKNREKTATIWRVINGSEFVWTYNINYTESELLIKENPIFDLEIEVNKIKNKNVICMPIIEEETTYFYFLTLKNKGIMYPFSSIYLRKFLKPFFHKSAKIISLERELKDQFIESLEKIKDKVLFVENAVIAMHFLRNKFQPVVSYFEILEKYQEAKKQGKDSTFLEEKLSSTAQQTTNSVSEMLNKTNQILERSKNPFQSKSKNVYSISSLYNIIRDVWLEYFDQSSIILNWEIAFDSEISFVFDEQSLEITLTDIINNMYQYSKGSTLVELFEKDNNYFVRFSNEVVVTDELKKNIHFLNNDHIDEIAKRTTHGLSLIKSYLNQLEIERLAELNDTKLTFTLTFKKATL